MAMEDIILWLSEKGFYQFFAPFALVFLLVYGTLLKTKPFGEYKDNSAISWIYAITSFLAGAFVLLFGLNIYIETFLAWVLGRAGIIIILLFAALIISAFGRSGMSGEEKND